MGNSRRFPTTGSGRLWAVVSIGVALATTGCQSDPQSDVLTPPAEPVSLQWRLVTESAPDTTESAEPRETGEEVELDAVWDKVGEKAAELAQKLTVVPFEHEDLATLAPFADLTPAEVSVLPASVQFYVPTVGCAQLDARDFDEFDAEAEVAACDSTVESSPPVKYLMAPAADIDVSDVDSVDSQADTNSPGKFMITLSLTGDGAKVWENLTADNVDSQVALIVGTDIISAPIIQGPIPGDMIQITGQFTADQASELAAEIDAGTRW